DWNNAVERLPELTSLPPGSTAWRTRRGGATAERRATHRYRKDVTRVDALA
ncbi:hypothetical protein EDWATA_01576, partial [Edwardsiella tarda ATCC 23685]